MAVQVDGVGSDTRVPFAYFQIDPTRAGAVGPGRPFRTLLIGQRLGAGRIPALAPRPVGTAADAAAMFGRGSMLEHMVAAFREHNRTGQLSAVALDDANAGAQATKTITVTGAATAAGTIALYVGGRLVPVPISGATAVDAVATAIANAINTDADLPATAAAAAAVVTVTARHAGTASDLDVRINYGAAEELPPGVAVTIAAGAAGATDPDIDGAIDAIADERFNLIVTPYTAAAEIAKLEAELEDRFGPVEQIDGLGIGAYRGAGGTVAQATTYGKARNSPHVSVMGIGKSPSPQYEWAAAVAGAVHGSAALDPARPLQSLALRGIRPQPVEDRWIWTERNGLLHDGIATHRVEAGRVRIERLVTTYQTNAAGVPDTAFLDAETVLTLSHLREDLRATFLRKFPRHKLADDGTKLDPGQPVLTPKTARAEVLALFRGWEARGLVEGGDQFKEDLVVERNAADPDRLDLLLPPDLINQLRVIAGRISFLR